MAESVRLSISFSFTSKFFRRSGNNNARACRPLCSSPQSLRSTRRNRVRVRNRKKKLHSRFFRRNRMYSTLPVVYMSVRTRCIHREHSQRQRQYMPLFGRLSLLLYRYACENCPADALHCRWYLLRQCCKRLKQGTSSKTVLPESRNCVQTFSPYNLRSAAEAAKKSQIKISPMLSEIESKAESPSENRVKRPILFRNKQFMSRFYTILYNIFYKKSRIREFCLIRHGK